MAQHKAIRVSPAIVNEMRFLVNRYVHAGSSDRRAIRIVIQGARYPRAPKRYKAFRSMPPAQRRQVLAGILRAHRANRELYVSVMSGRF